MVQQDELMMAGAGGCRRAGAGGSLPAAPRPLWRAAWRASPVRLFAVVVAAVTFTAGCGGSGSSRSSSDTSTGTRTSGRSVAVKNKTPPPRPRPATHTSCRGVVYIGDSTSDGETSSDYIPNPRQQLPAQLSKVGVATFYPEISGARSIVETYENYPNAATVAKAHISEGYHGCWILALGTNDVADVGAGSNFGLQTRIARMMSIIGHQPVLWVNVITLLGSGPYAESGMRHWNHDLLSDCPKFPTMRVYDWAARAKQQWFINDGIHYTSPGYVARTRLIAHALVKAFPRDQPASSSCLVP